MKKEDFKYVTQFEASASFDVKKWKEAKARKEAFASLADLRTLLPSDEKIEDNPDLLYVSFNAAVINLINSNDHGMTTETALAVSKYFVDRHMNLEHSRYDVVGHIISQGFSSFGENKMLKEKDLAGTTAPFNLSLGAVVYKVVREYIAEVIEESANQNEDYYQNISTSWEIGFNEYDIALGSKKLSDAEIISDEEKIKELSPFLKMEGGDGFLPDGTPIYCVIKGGARPLGCAFTGSPAAAVSGLFVPVTDNKEKKNSKSNGSTPAVENEPAEEEPPAKTIDEIVGEKVSEAIGSFDFSLEIEKNITKNNNNNKNHSQSLKNTVNKNMKLKSTEDITPEFLQTAEASTVIREFIVKKMEESSTPYVEQVETLKTEKKTVEDSLASIKADLASAKTELETIKKSVEDKEKQELFDSRMEEVSASYELNDAQVKVVASKIKDLDEIAYAAWKAESDLFFTKKVAPKEEGENQDDPTKALKTASASTTIVIPNSQTPEEDELKKLVASLGKAITVTQ